jgi:hypothetical protein
LGSRRACGAIGSGRGDIEVELKQCRELAHFALGGCNGDKKETQAQSQDNGQKNQGDQKKAGQEGAGTASITQEDSAQEGAAGREGRGQAEARPPAGKARGG